MKVLLVYQYYQGHDMPGHSTIYDLTQFLAQRGHKVTVVTGETGYMKQNLSTVPWWRRIVRHESCGKVNVVRTFTYQGLHRSYLGRLLSFLSFSLSCSFGLFSVDKPDVLLASSPPIFPIFSAWFFCKLLRIPFVLEVRDLWPASPVHLGIVKNRILIGITFWMERLLYLHSLKIVAMTKGIFEDICSRGCPERKVHLITSGINFSELYPDPLSGALIRERHGWQDKKIVMYFGSFGEANNLSVIIRSAQQLQAHSEIVFVLIGDGLQQRAIKEKIAELGLKNLFLLPPVPKFEARSFINAADLCLVTLKNIPLFRGAIPTKLLDYMACGKAVICGILGEAAQIVAEAGAGVIFEPDDDKQLGKLILELLRDPVRVEKMSAGGLAYVRKFYCATTMHEKIESVLFHCARS